MPTYRDEAVEFVKAYKVKHSEKEYKEFKGLVEQQLCDDTQPDDEDLWDKEQIIEFNKMIRAIAVAS